MGAAQLGISISSTKSSSTCTPLGAGLGGQLGATQLGAGLGGPLGAAQFGAVCQIPASHIGQQSTYGSVLGLVQQPRNW